jgi:Protein of unknown function (DUF3288)
MAEQRDQQHPQWRADRETMDAILSGEMTDWHLSELARLRIRYRGFPGARDIQADLEKALERWGLTEEALFERTRAIHEAAQVYKGRGAKRDDWS